MKISTKIETGANLAVIVLVALFAWTVVRGRTDVTAGPTQVSGPKVGLNLNQGALKDVNWSGNGRTLVLGLQTTCHFCTESGPFFQKLPSAASGNTKIIAVLPQSVEESKKYLQKLGVRVDEIRSAPLSDINVAGTPTLMLVDGKGLVKNVWVGKLPDEKQSEVLSAIAPKAPSRIAGL